jgi:hypothetical protein
MTEHHESTRSASSDALLRELADRAAIQDLIAAYGLGQDLHQDGDNDVLAQWDQVFAPDATVDYSATAPLEITWMDTFQVTAQAH